MKTDVFKLRKIAYAVLESKKGNRETSRTYGVSSSTVTRYTMEIKAAGLSWEELDKLNDGNCEIFLPFFYFLKNITFWCQSTQENVYGTNKQCCSH